MKREYVVKPKDLDTFARTKTGMRLGFNWTEKTDLIVYVPENKVWGLVELIEKFYSEEFEETPPTSMIV